jgi:hypothetical protein
VSNLLGQATAFGGELIEFNARLVFSSAFANMKIEERRSRERLKSDDLTFEQCAGKCLSGTNAGKNGD